VDLARVLSQPSSGESDFARAVILLRQAWNEGVTVAAFELGRLYENGVGGAPDSELAWSWYRRGADAGEPNALARLGAAADEAAATEENTDRRDAHLLEAFRYYAAAAERARVEDWADEVWWTWRYRRASLARVLAGEGLIEQVAAVHEAVLKQYARREPTTWARLAALVGLQ
jgi:TPR repeat protein